MATIINPNPVTPATFGGMWITRLQLVLPAGGKRGMLTARLLPYDGTHLLATGHLDLRLPDIVAKRQAEPALDAALSSLDGELVRQSGEQGPWRHLAVAAPDPAMPVVAVAITDARTMHRIPDCFALAATDPVFAAVLQGVMAEVARQAGLTVQ